MKNFLGSVALVGLSASAMGCAVDTDDVPVDLQEEENVQAQLTFQGCTVNVQTPAVIGLNVAARDNFSCTNVGVARSMCLWLRKNGIDQGSSEVKYTVSGSVGSVARTGKQMVRGSSSWKSCTQVHLGSTCNESSHSSVSCSGSI